MDDFSEFIKTVRISSDKESPIRKFADAVSKVDTLQKVFYLNGERDRLKSDCNYLLCMQQLFPNVNVSESLREKQYMLTQCESLLNQLGNNVISNEAQIYVADDVRKRIEEERRKQNRY